MCPCLFTPVFSDSKVIGSCARSEVKVPPLPISNGMYVRNGGKIVFEQYGAGNQVMENSSDHSMGKMVKRGFCPY